LQVAPGLHEYAKQGGAYIGVGPEQNFTYIAMVRPDVAFVVDIRRRNALVQLIYKALFEQAESRSHLLAMLLARPYEASSAPGPDARIEDILSHATKLPRSRDTLRETESWILDRIDNNYGVKLNWADRLAIKESLKAFYDDQLDIKFELLVKSKDRYPTLRELMTSADPKGQQQSYLASEEYFRFVQHMQRENRIVPLVGNFAGDRALLAIAAYLKEQDVPVTTFYVSNVEEYLLQDKLWPKWVRNIEALPIVQESLFIRAHLARGERDHPMRMPGHRTTTLLQRMADFRTRQHDRPFSEWQDVATHAVLAEP
jgi:hypothetical protein